MIFFIFSTIHSDENTLPVKTKAHPKTLNPNWNEFLVIPDVSRTTLHRSRLDIQVKHSKRLLKRSKEVLGYVSLKQHQILMYGGLIEVHFYLLYRNSLHKVSILMSPEIIGQTIADKIIFNAASVSIERV